MWMVPIAIVAMIILANAARSVKENEHGVVMRLGMFHTTKPPGLWFILPWIDRMIKIPIRDVMNVAVREVATKDNVATTVDAAIHFRVIDPEKAVMKTEGYVEATVEVTQNALKKLVGEVDSHRLLNEQKELRNRLRTTIDEMAKPWGVQITAVELTHVELT
jgi:regulator of protease activity HflC (stomatin/prohibitin superfamily)